MCEYLLYRADKIYSWIKCPELEALLIAQVVYLKIIFSASPMQVGGIGCKLKVEMV